MHQTQRAPKCPLCFSMQRNLPAGCVYAMGSCICARSRLVSTRINGASSSTTGAGRSRGTCTGAGSAAIAACTTAIFSGSEFTHCRPELWATASRFSTGKTNSVTAGIDAATAAGLVGVTEAASETRAAAGCVGSPCGTFSPATVARACPCGAASLAFATGAFWPSGAGAGALAGVAAVCVK